MFEGNFRIGLKNGDGVSYHKNGTISSIGTYEDGRTLKIKQYDEDGNLVTAYQGYDWDANGTLDYTEYTYTYEYDEDGNRISATSQQTWSDSVYMYDYEYDENGNLATIRQYVDSDSDGNSEEIRTYSYDANGNLIEDTYEADWDSDGFIDEMTQEIYEYDADGNVIYEENISQFDENGNPIDAWSNTYSTDGDIIESTYTDSDKYTYTNESDIITKYVVSNINKLVEYLLY